MKKSKVYDSVFILIFALVVLGILATESESVSAMLMAIAAIFGFWKYVDTRNRELAWKHTEFLFDQAAYLDNDPEIGIAVRVLAGSGATFTVDDLFQKPTLPINATENEKYHSGFEKLLNLLDRLAYAHLSKETLSMDELANFKWYLYRVSDNTNLATYCKEHGFGDIVEVAGRIRGAKC